MSQNKYINRHLFFILAWSFLIFYLSSITDLRIADKNLLDFILRKIAHISEYFVLYFLSFRYFSFSNLTSKISKYRYVYSLIYCVLYAISDEYHQTFIVGREGCVRDVLIDVVGVIICGLCLKYFLKKK